MGKLTVELPEEIHAELKRRATLHRGTIKEIVTGLLEEYLSEGEETKVLKETGLCGSWVDARSENAIIADIKRRRNYFSDSSPS